MCWQTAFTAYFLTNRSGPLVQLIIPKLAGVGRLALPRLFGFEPNRSAIGSPTGVVRRFVMFRFGRITKTSQAQVGCSLLLSLFY